MALPEHLIPPNVGPQSRELPCRTHLPNVEVLFVAEVDRDVNPLGIKGVGELGGVGTDAAVCNAIYHATGVRIRDSPVRIEKLLG